MVTCLFPSFFFPPSFLSFSFSSFFFFFLFYLPQRIIEVSFYSSYLFFCNNENFIPSNLNCESDLLNIIEKRGHNGGMEEI